MHVYIYAIRYLSLAAKLHQSSTASTSDIQNIFWKVLLITDNALSLSVLVKLIKYNQSNLTIISWNFKGLKRGGLYLINHYNRFTCINLQKFPITVFISNSVPIITELFKFLMLLTNILINLLSSIPRVCNPSDNGNNFKIISLNIQTG